MGTPDFSVPILEALTKKYNVVAVVTQPDRPVGRKRVLTPTPVKKAALALDIEVLQPEKITKSEEMAYIIDEIQPDLIVTAAFGQFLPETLLNAPKYGSINVHASLLPKYRGGAPIHYAVMNGEEETGITIMYMEKRMDAGDIISQSSIRIKENDDTGTLFQSLSILGKELLMETLPKIFTENINPIKQNEQDATYSPNISREQEKIDWNQLAEKIHNKIRGLRPFPGAFTFLDGSRMKIWASSLSNKYSNEKPGTILNITEEEIEIACGNGTVLSLNELQPSGKARMPVKAFLLGAGQEMKEGEQFGE